MRSTEAAERPVTTRRAWEAPAITELPIHTQTQAASTQSAVEDRSAGPTPPPASPSSKLGFAFEMSFPLAVRTE